MTFDVVFVPPAENLFLGKILEDLRRSTSKAIVPSGSSPRPKSPRGNRLSSVSRRALPPGLAVTPREDVEKARRRVPRSTPWRS
jgi:hypothetical protein